MTFGTILNSLIGRARVAFAAVVFLIVPMADASACAKEPIDVEMTASMERAADIGMQDHSAPEPGDISHCVHGHCHQPMSVVNLVSIDAQLLAKASLIASIDAGALMPRFETGLDRPPKAGTSVQA